MDAAITYVHAVENGKMYRRTTLDDPPAHGYYAASTS